MESSRVYTPRAFSAFSVFRDARVLPVRKSTTRIHHCGLVTRGNVFLSSWGGCRFRSVEVKSYSSHSSAESTPKLSFTLPCKVPFGVVLRLVGSTYELGEWLIDNGIDFKWSEGHVWRLTVHNPPTQTCSYKVVAINTFDGSVEWETCNNRELEPCESDTDIELAWNEWVPTKQVPSGTAEQEEEVEQVQSEVPETREEQLAAPTEAVVEETVGEVSKDEDETEVEEGSRESGDGSWNVESAVDEEAGVGIESDYTQSPATDGDSSDATGSLDECSSVVEAVELKADKAQESAQGSVEGGPNDNNAVVGRSDQSEGDIKDVEATSADTLDVGKDSSPDESEGSSPEGVPDSPVLGDGETAGTPTESAQPGPTAFSNSNDTPEELDEFQAAVVLGKEPILPEPERSVKESNSNDVSEDLDEKQATTVAGKEPTVSKAEPSPRDFSPVSDPLRADASGKVTTLSESSQNVAESDNNNVSGELVEKQATVVAKEEPILSKAEQSVDKVSEGLNQKHAAVVAEEEPAPSEPEQSVEQSDVSEAPVELDQKHEAVMAEEETTPSEPEPSVGQSDVSDTPKGLDQQEAAVVAKVEPALSEPEQIVEQSDVDEVSEEEDQKQTDIVAKEEPVLPEPEQSVELSDVSDTPKELDQQDVAVVAKGEPALSEPEQIVEQSDVDEVSEEEDQKQTDIVAKEEPVLPESEQIVEQSDVDEDSEEEDQKQTDVVANEEPVLPESEQIVEQSDVDEVSEEEDQKQTDIVANEEPVLPESEQIVEQSDVNDILEEADQKQAAVVAEEEPSLSEPEQSDEESDVNDIAEEADQERAPVVAKEEPTLSEPEQSVEQSDVHDAPEEMRLKGVAAVTGEEPTLSETELSVKQPDVHDIPEELNQKKVAVVAEEVPMSEQNVDESNFNNIPEELDQQEAAVVDKEESALPEPEQNVELADVSGDLPSSEAEMAMSAEPTTVEAEETTTESDVVTIGVESTSAEAATVEEKGLSVEEVEESPVPEVVASTGETGGDAVAGLELNGAGKKKAVIEDEPSIADLVISDEDGSVLFTSDFLSREVPEELAAAFDSLLPEAYRQGEKEKDQQGGDGTAAAGSDESSGGDGKGPLSPALTVAALGVGTAVLGSFGLELTDAIVGGAMLFVGSAAVLSKNEEARRKKPGTTVQGNMGVGRDTGKDEKLRATGSKKRRSKEGSAPGVALAALLMVPLIAGSKMLNSVEKVKTKSEEPPNTESET